MSNGNYQGPPSWKVPPPGGWPQQPSQPQSQQMQPWQQPQPQYPQAPQYPQGQYPQGQYPQGQYPQPWQQAPVMLAYAPTCPCGYAGPVVMRGGVNVLGAMILCFLCLIPGLIYIMTSREERCCPRCNARLG